MAQVKIFWDPTGLTVDSLGKKRFLRAIDGDTPSISVSIRNRVESKESATNGALPKLSINETTKQTKNSADALVNLTKD